MKSKTRDTIIETRAKAHETIDHGTGQVSARCVEPPLVKLTVGLHVPDDAQAVCVNGVWFRRADTYGMTALEGDWQSLR